MEVVASLSQGRTAAAQCGLFTYKSVPVILEPPCTKREWEFLTEIVLKIKSGIHKLKKKNRRSLKNLPPEGWHEAGSVLWNHKNYKFSRPGFAYPWINVLWDVTLGC